MDPRITRRHFIQTNLAAALATTAFPAILSASARGKEGTVAPQQSDRTRLHRPRPTGQGRHGRIPCAARCASGRHL